MLYCDFLLPLRRLCTLFFCVLLMSASLSGHAFADESNLTIADEPIQPISTPEGLNPDQVELGRKIFNDTRLSKDNTLSCASCHMESHGGAVNMQHSPQGANGKSVAINVPTFLGSHLNFTQFWDGRAATLEDQVDGPIANVDEMGSSWPEIIVKMNADPEYVQTFQRLYNRKPDPDTIKAALSQFEKSQTPINAPFDLYLKGDATAIDARAKQGYTLFKDLGCASCHQGVNVGGNMFQRFGIIRDYFEERGDVIDKDYGRFNVTHQEEDRYVFKVPSLRNVDLTSPYFHDGTAKTLEEAVDIMAKYQLGRDLSTQERDDIVIFLKSLTGKIPAEYAGDQHE